MDEEKTKAGSAVNTTINTDGWKYHIRPLWDAKIQQYSRGFANAKTFEDFVRAQAGYKIISELLDSIAKIIEDGQTEIDKSKEHPSQ